MYLLDKYGLDDAPVVAVFEDAEAAGGVVGFAEVAAERFIAAAVAGGEAAGEVADHRFVLAVVGAEVGRHGDFAGEEEVVAAGLGVPEAFVAFEGGAAVGLDAAEGFGLGGLNPAEAVGLHALARPVRLFILTEVPRSSNY